MSSNLKTLLVQALDGEPTALETYLRGHSNLPGPRMNTGLAREFARLVGELVVEPDVSVGVLERLLDGWVALPLEVAPVNGPGEMLPSVAVLTYGQVAVCRPDWREDELGKLRRAAADSRWRVREMVATALQTMLKADWSRTCYSLEGWLTATEPLVIRAVAAALAEPPLLTSQERTQTSLAFQARAIQFLLDTPAQRRKNDDLKILRQALGYTLSVAVAASPQAGLALLQKLATSSDPDLEWIVRENWKKNRLKKYLSSNNPSNDRT